LLRTLIADVTLLPERHKDEVRIGVRWHTGATDEITAGRIEPGRTPAAALDLIRRHGATHTSEQLAEMLNAAGLRTGRGHRWTKGGVARATSLTLCRITLRSLGAVGGAPGAGGGGGGGSGSPSSSANAPGLVAITLATTSATMPHSQVRPRPARSPDGPPLASAISLIWSSVHPLRPVRRDAQPRQRGVLNRGRLLDPSGEEGRGAARVQRGPVAAELGIALGDGPAELLCAVVGLVRRYGCTMLSVGDAAQRRGQPARAQFLVEEPVDGVGDPVLTQVQGGRVVMPCWRTKSRDARPRKRPGAAQRDAARGRWSPAGFAFLDS
jgi:hypothetical protein